MNKSALSELVKDEYPTSKAAIDHGERLWKKHLPVINSYGERDRGRVHSTIHCIAMLHDAGHTEAAEKLGHFLEWMTSKPEEPTRETPSISEGMSGAH